MARILVIDDNALVIEVARQALEGAGHEVTVTLSALGATALGMRCRAELVLLDVCMPALRGDSLVPVLRQSLPHTAILFYSALDERELAQLAAKQQVDGYILKTVRPSQLVRTINEVLRTRERFKTI